MVTVQHALYLSRIVDPSGLKVGCIDLPSTIPKLAIFFEEHCKNVKNPC
jgi:hypothetical protein